MKNPNGFGTVTKLSGKRRKPWVAKVTVGFNSETGKQIQKSIGTFETRADAMKQLSLYHVSKEDKNLALEMDPKNARNIQKKARISHTFEECVRGGIEREKDGKSNSWLKARRLSMNILKNITDKNIEEITIKDVQEIFDTNTQYSMSSLTNCITTCNLAFTEAMLNRWIHPSDNFMKYVKVKSKAKRHVIHTAFSKDEIKIILNDNSIEAKIVLVYIFTGCRASELLKISEIHEDYIICGLKTDSGKNRKIPIHPYIKPFIYDILDHISNHNYDWIKRQYMKVMKKYNLNYTLHDARNTFATLGKECNMKPTAVKKIMGHKLKDLTDDVYTHESIEYLKNEIEKIVIN